MTLTAKHVGYNHHRFGGPTRRFEEITVMERDKIREKVLRVVAQVLKIETGQIQEQHSFTSDLGAQSVQSIELMAGFEEEFGIEMNEDEALKVQNVGAAIDFIAKYLD